MKASVVDLRYRMNEVLWALEHNEDVRILSRGKLKGIIKPADGEPRIKVRDHPFFSMKKGFEAVKRQMDTLRGGRYRDL